MTTPFAGAWATTRVVRHFPEVGLMATLDVSPSGETAMLLTRRVGGGERKLFGDVEAAKIYVEAIAALEEPV